ncbi:hypothetical protein HID58_085534 [Brassica napus]|nr:hypothetical protein HID58_085534 [Brassica napus]
MVKVLSLLDLDPVRTTALVDDDLSSTLQYPVSRQIGGINTDLMLSSVDTRTTSDDKSNANASGGFIIPAGADTTLFGHGSKLNMPLP